MLLGFSPGQCQVTFSPIKDKTTSSPPSHPNTFRVFKWFSVIQVNLGPQTSPRAVILPPLPFGREPEWLICFQTLLLKQQIA